MNGICPYCQLKVHFSQVLIYGRGGGERIPLSFIKLSNKEQTEVTIVTCDNCIKTLVAFFEYKRIDKSMGVFEVKSTYPVISKIAKPNGVTQRIWDDYVEGMICLGVNAPKGAVVLFRRATQSLMKELGANPNNYLWKQIKELKEKGIINENLSELATELRLWGNFGAHPDDDLLDEVTIEEAEEMKKLLDMLLKFTIIQKAEVEAIRERRKKKKG